MTTETFNLKHELKGFTGTEHYYKHWLGQITYTDGVKYMAERAGAHWLIDAVASYQTGKIKAMPFQVWHLERGAGNKAVLTMKQDSGQPVEVRQDIEFTDFPLDKFDLWLIDGVIILPSEY